MSRNEPPMRLSLCMIVRDSARTLEPCLASIRPWVDEMVVVDTGSIDDTPAIAERLGARLLHSPWCDDFSAARNESLRHGRGEWLFWMDADDTIDAANGRKLRELADRPLDDAPLARMMQCHYTGPDAAERPDATVVNQIKMFRNRPELRFEGRIHEQVLPSIQRLGGRIEWTDLFVTHSGCDHSPEGRRRKFERDLRLLRMEETERPNQPFTLFNLGMTLVDMGRPADAIPALVRCLEVSSPEMPHVRKAFALLVASHTELKQYDQARQTCEQGRRLFPDDVDLLFREGVLARQMGRLQEAVRAFQAVLRQPAERRGTIMSADPARRLQGTSESGGRIHRAGPARSGRKSLAAGRGGGSAL